MIILPKLALVLIAAFTGLNPAGDETAVLGLKDLAGTEQTLSQYRGKVVVVNFWATWCEPCEEEMHEFVDARKKFSADDVIIVAASLDDAASQKNIPKFVKQQKMSFPVWIGATVDDLQRLGLGEGVPGTLVLNRQGRIVARVRGPVSRKELKERIEWALVNTADHPVPLLDHFNKNKK